MNVEQMIEILDGYGGHLPVAVVIEQRDKQFVYKDFDLDDRTVDGDVTVALTIYKD